MSAKKRKRPRAKDWPPTSTQKRTLVPYGRPFKLPRLDESPFKEVWIKIVRLTLADLQGYKGCCRKMKYFRQLHHELLLITEPILLRAPVRCYNPLLMFQRRKSQFPRLIIYCWSTYVAQTSGFDLEWVPDEENVNIEKLIWSNLKTGATGEISRFSETKEYVIFRYLRVSYWQAFICDYIYGRLEEHDIKLVGYMHSEYNDIGCSTLETMVQMAPKCLNRWEAKERVFDMIRQSPRMDPDSSLEEEEEEAETYPNPPWHWNGN